MYLAHEAKWIGGDGHAGPRPAQDDHDRVSSGVSLVDNKAENPIAHHMMRFWGSHLCPGQAVRYRSIAVCGGTRQRCAVNAGNITMQA